MAPTTKETDVITLNAPTNFPIKLTATNFSVWSRQVQASLIGLDLSGFIDGSTKPPAQFLDDGKTPNPLYSTWHRQDQILVAALLGSCSEAIQPTVASAATARDVWLRLSNSYASTTPGRVLFLKAKLAHNPKGSRSVAEYLKDMSDISDSLALAGSPVMDDDLVASIITQLGEDYRSVYSQEAELSRKDRIHRLDIKFEKDEVEGSSSLWMEVMEALEPNQKLNQLFIWEYGGSRLPQWISSPFSRVKEIYLITFDELSSLPPLGKLPFLEFLNMVDMKKLKFVGREFLGVESSSSTLVAFPKLKILLFDNFPEWLEWEDITAEEEESNLVSIMPRLEALRITSCNGLKKLPRRLLRKACSTLRVLNIKDSLVLESQYGDKDGLEWRSMSQYNPQLQLRCNAS